MTWCNAENVTTGQTTGGPRANWLRLLNLQVAMHHVQPQQMHSFSSSESRRRRRTVPQTLLRRSIPAGFAELLNPVRSPAPTPCLSAVVVGLVGRGVEVAVDIDQIACLWFVRGHLLAVGLLLRLRARLR